MEGLKSYYPVYLDLNGRLAVVIGGGHVAERKVKTLLRHGAQVLVVSPEVGPDLELLEDECAVTVERRGYVRGDLENAFVVVCATDAPEVNRAVFEEAEDRGCLVNVVDVPELCNFIVPSIVHRGPFQIAISTAGAAPAVAKRVRKRLSEEFGDEWGAYVMLMGQVRTLVMERVPDAAERKRMFEAMADSDLLARIAAGETPAAEKVFTQFAPVAGGQEPQA